MAIRSDEIVSRASSLLFDLTQVRWPTAELLLWIADAQQLIAQQVPDSVSVTTSITLVPGTKQRLPSSPIAYNRLISLVRNLGAGGAEPGAGITLTTREALDAVRPNWHADVGSTEIQHYVYDPEADRLTFWVYPGLPESTRVEAVLARACPTTIALGQDLIVSDMWSNTVLDWVMFRALSKQSDFGSAGPRAESHARAFAAAVGMEYSTRGLTNPNRELKSRGADQ